MSKGTEYTSETVVTTPVEGGQKPGTSGLRKKTRDFMKKDFLENFTQSVFNSLFDEKVPVKGGTLVLSGDGRFYNKEAVQIITRIAIANGVDTIWIGKDALLSTPAASAVIRTHKTGFVPFGGFILSASHNPGGIDEDFGIKYNCENGGPAPVKVTDAVFTHSKTITSYKTFTNFPTIDVGTIGTTELECDGRRVCIEVFDCAEDHVNVLKKCFDFEAIKAFVNRDDFSMVYDCMNGVQGPYAQRVFVEELGLDAKCLLNSEVKEDFGGPESAHHGHADPNLTHARALVAAMGLDSKGNKVGDGASCPDFGAAADGDADRNMITGRQFFVSPSDSLAVICANADLLPCFQEGLKGCARSMPTSCALDRVAEAKGIPCFETPTGWKFFGNLMDASSFSVGANYSPFLCGEESFGTGSDHVREKDGMWAVLAWLQILAAKNTPGQKLVGVQEIVESHWKTYGRNYYARYDYEGVSKDRANQVMEEMAKRVQDKAAWSTEEFKLKESDNFSYTDPVDKDAPVATNQGIRWIFEDGSRIVFRLSGTGVSGATIRMYLEKYAGSNDDLTLHPFETVKPLAERAMLLSDLPKVFPADDADKNDATGARLGLKTDAGIAVPSVIT
eukprot:TRINITY_DN1527_c0_g1_i2.p1 TRINITY_DN1527_c0_g1~~TRINITY_DN1527_c0_g1_i2.p1  ORF type:complete len:618 (+),score=264.46 TRINITY_DN1527_c0_g1_i2:555-2408(+)